MTDTIVRRRDSLRLADRFADPLIIEHDGGHIIPGQSSVTGPISSFLTRPFGDAKAATAHGAQRTTQ